MSDRARSPLQSGAGSVGEEPSAEGIGAWIVGRMVGSSPNTVTAAKWRVLLAAFWDATRDDFPTQERRPDRPQWDIISLRSALENWGRHHDWCEFSPEKPCNCGLEAALNVGQYATLDPNGYGKSSGEQPKVVPDYPDADGTDAAHPAWWRGNDRGVEATVEALNKILDSGRDGGTFGYRPLEELANRIAARPLVSPDSPDIRGLLDDLIQRAVVAALMYGGLERREKAVAAGRVSIESAFSVLRGEVERLRGVEKRVSELGVRSINVEDGAVKMELVPSREVLTAIAAAADQMLDVDNDSGQPAANYVEMQFRNAKGLPLTLTVQRPFAKTPHQLREEAEAELARLQAEQLTPDEAEGVLWELGRDGEHPYLTEYAYQIIAAKLRAIARSSDISGKEKE